MSPSVFTKVASHWFVRRWWLAAASAIGIGAVFLVSWLGFVGVGGALAGPLVGLPWALLCICVWFHPERGNMQPGSKIVGKLPAVLQSALRWYAAIFLSF